MKLYHMADLHLGISTNGFSMLPDQEYILDRVLELLKRDRPAGLLLAGDIYDRQAPSAEAVRLLDRFLTETAALDVPVLMISGNHDSPERLSFASGILERRGVHIYGSYDGTVHTVTLRDEHGPVKVHLLPYLRPSSVRRFFPERTVGSWQEAVEAALEHHEVDPAVRNVLVAHQFVVRGAAEPERSESETGPVGGVDAVDAALFDRFDYVALGHLHGPQTLAGARMRYAGSPLKYSFSECSHHKSVTVAELGPKGETELSAIPLVPRRDLRRIRGPLKELLSEEVASQGNREDYLHITLTDEEEILDAIGWVRSVYPNVMALGFDNRRSRADSAREAGADIQARPPLELFADFYREQNGSDLSDAQMELARAMLEGGEE